MASEDDQPTGLFADIMRRSKDSKNNCMYGPEYLLFLPILKKFVTFFMGTKTARRESQFVTARIWNDETKEFQIAPASFTSRLIKSGQYSWYGPKSRECQAEFEYPTKEAMEAELAKFNNPTDGVTTADLAEPPSTERDR
jgi:hypothetical protein